MFGRVYGYLLLRYFYRLLCRQRFANLMSQFVISKFMLVLAVTTKNYHNKNDRPALWSRGLIFLCQA